MNIIKYEKKFGEITFPEGFEETLKDLPLEEQMNYFRTSSCVEHSNTEYSSRTIACGYNKLEDDSNVKGIIVKDNLIVGIMIRDAWRRIMPCTPEESICTCYDFDDDDSEQNIIYTWFLCVPANFEN